MTHGTQGPQWIVDESRKAEKMTDKTDDGYEITPPISTPPRRGVKCGKCGMKFEDLDPAEAVELLKAMDKAFAELK